MCKTLNLSSFEGLRKRYFKKMKEIFENWIWKVFL